MSYFLMNEGGKEWVVITGQEAFTCCCFKSVFGFGLKLFAERWKFNENSIISLFFTCHPAYETGASLRCMYLSALVREACL